MTYTQALAITRNFFTIIATRKATQAEATAYAQAAKTLTTS